MNKRINEFSKLKALLVLFSVMLTACSSVTIRPDGGIKDTSEANYIDSKPFYVLGIFGKHKVDVNEACEGTDVLQMQTVTTSSDWILGVITFGIYSPRTAKVWCSKTSL